jgi:hypothetical protein
MIVNRTIEYVNFRSSTVGTGKSPVFLRSMPGSEKGHDTVEISEDARKSFLDNSTSSLEKALLRALPSLEQFREHLRETERDEDIRRRERVDMLKSRMYGKNYDMESMELAQAAEEMISQFEGK